MPRTPGENPQALDKFVEPTDWSKVPEPYDDPSQDPESEG